MGIIGNKSWYNHAMKNQACALCLQKKELLNIHIIPKFISDWFVSTSPTGYMREACTPNLRRQDGDREHLLCYDCEQLFSKWEHKFAKEVFYPYVNNNSKISFIYKEWLEKFIISVAWRYIVTNGEQFNKASPEIQKLISETTKEW